MDNWIFCFLHNIICCIVLMTKNRHFGAVYIHTKPLGQVFVCQYNYIMCTEITCSKRVHVWIPFTLLSFSVLTVKFNYKWTDLVLFLSTINKLTNKHKQMSKWTQPKWTKQHWAWHSSAPLVLLFCSLWPSAQKEKRTYLI